MQDEDRARLIAAQNDRFRQNFSMPYFGARGVPGQFVCTRGIAALSSEAQIEVWTAVANANIFEEENDPYGEHDFGAVSVAAVGEPIFWKIDYYADQSCTFGSEDPADPMRCYRVLTIMLASEY